MPSSRTTPLPCSDEYSLNSDENSLTLNICFVLGLSGKDTLYFIDYHNYFYPFEFCDNENRFSQGGDGLIPVPVLLDYYVALDSRYYGEESKKEKETTIETSNVTSNSFLDNIPME